MSVSSPVRCLPFDNVYLTNFHIVVSAARRFGAVESAYKPKVNEGTLKLGPK